MSKLNELRDCINHHIENMANDLFYNSYGSTTTANSDAHPESSFTLDDLNEAMDKLESIEIDFWKNIYVEKGFDPDKDLIVMCNEVAEDLNIKKDKIPKIFRGRISFSDMLDGNVYFVKGDILLYDEWV